MSETLSVINEHITDMNSPRAAYANGNKRDTMSSIYSNVQPTFTRHSYIAGHETDEEEHQLHTEEDVLSWGPARVAEYLEDHGVEPAHCEVFKEQEITGEVLLAMDQNSVFIKEFDLGAIGRRLKTWHKIKALQDEVRRSASPSAARSNSEYSALEADDGANVDVARNRSSTVGAPTLPRGLATLKRQSVEGIPMPDLQMESGVTGGAQRNSVGFSPLQAMTSSSRPSAQNIRNLNHSRRHSSMDSNSTDGIGRMSQRKQPSIDQKWEPGMPVQGHAYTASTDAHLPQKSTGFASTASPEDLDRGYFSSTEVDSRNRRSVLTKRNSAVLSSMNSRNGPPSTSDMHREPVSPILQSTNPRGALAAINNKFGSYRSATTPATNNKPMQTQQSPLSPVVTKLDHTANLSSSALTASPSKIPDNTSDASSEKAQASPASRYNFGMFSSAKAKVAGLRATTDPLAKGDKFMFPNRVDPPNKSPTGSSTPSIENKSLDLSKSDLNSRTSTGSGPNLMPPLPPKRPRAKTKTKKATSAYTRGLEKKSPQEQMKDCHYSGWMKKKSGSLMTTWKPRLFVLRGCRLSYYYSEDDEEEKGLIDISFHRVLPAQNEALTGFHATVTGAAGNPASPSQGSTPTMAEKDLLAHPPQKGEDGDGLFIFKLVPPKAGLSKGVNFTKPTVHYFAVNSRQEGRLWMAALMKATIDRDEDGVVTTTYNQKTISLAKARARRERPPALKDDDVVEDRAELDASPGATADEMNEKGLGIGGLGETDSAVAAAEVDQPDASSIAPSTVPSTIAPSTVAPSTVAAGDESDLNEKEREAVALNT